MNTSPREEPMSIGMKTSPQILSEVLKDKTKHHTYTRTEMNSVDKKDVQKKGHRKHLSQAEMNLERDNSENRKRSPDTKAIRAAYMELEERGIDIDLHIKPSKALLKKRSLGVAELIPMIPSQADRPCDHTHIPKPDYKLRTLVDENLVELTARESLVSLNFGDKDPN